METLIERSLLCWSAYFSKHGKNNNFRIVICQLTSYVVMVSETTADLHFCTLAFIHNVLAENLQKHQ